MRAATESDDSTDPDTPADDLLTCNVGNDFSRSRDSNVYGSVIADAATLEAPTLTKPLGTIQRMFPLILNNPDTTSDKDFCLVIKDQPAGGRASFYPVAGSATIRLLHRSTAINPTPGHGTGRRVVLKSNIRIRQRR